jgi:glycerol uptake operon antiterminator
VYTPDDASSFGLVFIAKSTMDAPPEAERYVPGEFDMSSSARSLPDVSRKDGSHKVDGRSHGSVSAELSTLRRLLAETPIIPAVRNPEHLDAALAGHGKVVYFLCGDPENIVDLLQKTLAGGKIPIVNMDLLSGFSRDATALSYLQKRGLKGIISTHHESFRHAHALGMYVIQRTFLLDRGAMESVANQLKSTAADALEVLPAIAAPRLVESIRTIRPEMPLVGGGLIQSMREIEDLLAQGLTSVSVSNTKLWIP